jgi:hypothetical protein
MEGQTYIDTQIDGTDFLSISLRYAQLAYQKLTKRYKYTDTKTANSY